MQKTLKYVYMTAIAIMISGVVAVTHASAVTSNGSYWEIPITAAVGANDSNTLYVGGDVTATAGFDNAFDSAALLAGNIRAYFDYPNFGVNGQYYWRDYRNLSFPQSWTFYVAAGSPVGAAITVYWDMANAPQGGISFTLTDTVSGTVIDMSAQNTYSYTASNNAPRAFTVTTGSGAIADSVAPETQILSVTGGSSVTLNYTGSDNISDITMLTFSVSVDGGTWSTPTSGTTTTLNGLTQAAHTFSVRAVDAAGNVDQTPAVATYIVDATPPALYVNARGGNPNFPVRLTSGPRTLSSTVTWNITGSATDASGIDAVVYEVADSYGKYSSAGSATLDASGAFSISLQLPSDLVSRLDTRVYTVTITAKDKAGNTTVKIVKGYVGVRPPRY